MQSDANSSGRILDAALALFSANGYEATSMREICERAGITKPTLYYFFQNKEGIYRALIRTAMDEFVMLTSKALSVEGDLRDRLKSFAEMMFHETGGRPELARFLFTIVWQPTSPFAAEVHTSYSTVVGKISTAITAAAKKGEVRPGDVNVRSLVTMGALAEAISNSLVMGSPSLTRKLAHSIIDTIFDGWQPTTTKARK